jgi:hypothetical protein
MLVEDNKKNIRLNSFRSFVKNFKNKNYKSLNLNAKVFRFIYYYRAKQSN